MEYESSAPPAFRARAYRAVIGFAVMNVVFVLAVSQSVLGPIPLSIFPLVVAANYMSVFAMPLFWAMTRGWGLKLIDLVAWEACLIALAWLNFWCFVSMFADV